jgi:hypothetical protein
MVLSTIVASIQIYSIKTTPSNKFNKSRVQKQMSKCGFGHKLHDLVYFELKVSFYIFIVHKELEAISKKVVEKCEFNP